MTLDEAIQHCKEVYNKKTDCESCCNEHLQLMIWLEELKDYRKRELEKNTMYNKDYTGEKNLKNSDVFNSCTIWPADWFKCTKVARNLGYKYIDFNGNIYDLNDYNECEGIDYKKTICEREDLMRG